MAASVVGSDEFIELVGPRTMAAFGRLWSEIADELNLDPDNQVARAMATHETWSGIVVSWPVDDTSERLPVELSGLPVFDRDRTFRGYRGFGVCRDIERINQLARARRERPAGFMPAATDSAAATAAPTRNLAATTRRRRRPTIEAAESQPSRRRNRSGRRPTAIASSPAAGGQCRAVSLSRRRPKPKAPPALSPVERRAFRELAQELTARLRGPQQAPRSPRATPKPCPPNRRRCDGRNCAGAGSRPARTDAARPHSDRHSDLPARLRCFTPTAISSNGAATTALTPSKRPADSTRSLPSPAPKRPRQPDRRRRSRS